MTKIVDMDETTELRVDPERYDPEDDSNKTTIFVRAKLNEQWLSVDIADLDKESLLVWLRSRGGKSEWAEDTVGIMLGHGHLTNWRPDEGVRKDERQR